MDDIERCARAMGMKPHREVVEVAPVDDGTAARTHDGQWTLVRDDGTCTPVEAPVVLERDSGVEPATEPAAKPAAKRRAKP